MVTEFTPLAGLAGGVLIGLAAVLLMGGIGRIAGISGIFGGLLTAMPDSDASWRAVFIAGLILGSLAVVAACAVTYICCWAMVALCAALESAWAVAWYRLPMATAGATPRLCTLACVTESVI